MQKEVSRFDLQGHRGARGLAPENTIAGFCLALDIGVNSLELDTVVSSDGEVVVSHEPWMAAEICSHPDGRPVSADEERSLNIFRMRYEEVAQFDCGLRGHPRFPEQAPARARKPLLRDVFEASDAHARSQGRSFPVFNVETKSKPAWYGHFCPRPEEFVELLWKEVLAAGVENRFILQSFDPATLQVARDAGLPIRLALLVEGFGIDEGEPVVAIDLGLEILGFTPDIFSPHHGLVTAESVEHCQAMGMAILPWTVNGAEEMRRLLFLGADGLITDYPDRGVTVIESL